jgi:hypothetical protein
VRRSTFGAAGVEPRPGRRARKEDCCEALSGAVKVYHASWIEVWGLIHPGRDIMGNLDFTDDAGFSAYCVALLVVSVIMFGLAAYSAARRTGTAAVITTTLVGLAGFGYAVYLIFMFKGGTYYVSYYVFILPVLITVRLLQGRSPGRRPKGHTARAKQFKQQVKVGDATYQQQMAAAGAAQQNATGKDAVQVQATSGETVASSQQ